MTQLKGTEIWLKNSYGHHTLAITSSRAKMTWTSVEKNIQIININKTFTAFATMIKHEKHFDNTAKIS